MLTAEALTPTGSDAVPTGQADGVRLRVWVQDGPPLGVAHVSRAVASGLVDGRALGCRRSLRRVVTGPGREVDARQGLACALLLALDDCWAGRWEEAERLTERALTTFTVTECVDLAEGFRGCLGVIAALRGEVTPRSRGLLELLPESSSRRPPWARQEYARLMRSLSDQRFDSAFEEASALMEAEEVPFAERAAWGSLALIEAAARTGRTATAKDVAGHVASFVASLPKGRVLWEHRMLAAQAIVAQPEVAPRLYLSALAVPGVQRWVFEVARTKLLLGEQLRRNREPDQATPVLWEALWTFGPLGAQPWERRAGRALRTRGTTPMDARKPPSSALSAIDLHVADMAAAGYTNKEIGQALFLSPRTVASRLYRVFPELGVSSRAGLRDALRRLEGVEEIGLRRAR